MTEEVRVRFAPSPTGDLHIGNTRTALFNYLFARHCGGKMILRIEDTDAERSTEEAERGILASLKWLEIEYDEGPYYQSQRGEHYNQALQQLAESGLAYRCFCDKERLAALREQLVKEKKLFVYDRCCLSLDPAEADRRAAAGESFTWRLRTPDDGATAWDDLVRGPVSVEHAQIGDFVIARADGSPIYLLACAVDDAEMKITHVIRGEDHLTNTARQLLILEAMGQPRPAYAHLPLIFGPDRKKLSKRHGAAFTLEFKKQGILPEAMFNHLALVGWALDDKTEIFSAEELCKVFTLERINKAAAIFDHDKLLYLNGHYLRQLNLEKLVALTREVFAEQGEPLADDLDPEWLSAIVAMQQERIKTLAQLPEKLRFFLSDDLEYDEKAIKKFITRESVRETAFAVLEDGGRLIESTEPFTIPALEDAFRQYAEARELKFGKIAQPLRVALTGSSASPSLFDVIHCLGKEKCRRRIAAAIEQFR